MTLGEFLKEKREQERLTINQLSELTNISTAQISRLENNEHNPKLSTILELSKVLKFSPNELPGSGYNKIEEGKKQPILEIPMKDGKVIGRHHSSVRFEEEPPSPIEQIIEKTAEKTNKKIDILTEMLKKVYEDDLKEEEDLPPGALRMKISTAKLPLVTGVKCGNFICPAEETYEMISVPESWGEVADFVIQVSGNSMEQYYIADGFYVAIKKQNTCSPGDIVLICDYDETDISKGVLKKAKSVNGIGLVFQNGTGDIIPMSESYRIEGIAVKWGML